MNTKEFSLFGKETVDWFMTHVGMPTAVQKEGWPAIAKGGHVLISAPTGTGKTLSAFLVYIDRLKEMARLNHLPDTLHLIYLSPLKALGNDIRENLKKPLEGIAGPNLRVAIRTGDTPASERQKMLKSPPHILITTPESLFLLLSGQNGIRMLSTAKAVIIDELHAVINTKRGAHMALSLARLDALCDNKLQKVGLSATIEPLDVAARFLAFEKPVQIVAPSMKKALSIEVNSPLPDMRILPEGTIWPELAKAVYSHCRNTRTVIVFTESRTQAEKLAYQVNQIAGEGFARTHHGCVSRQQRLEAERQLKNGELRLLCATSSMELGIDVGEVDLVLQIGFPRTISGTMQRLGRAGHNPGRTSIMHMFPRTIAEGIYCGLTASVALDGGIEHSAPPVKCLDVLAQHLVSMAVTFEYTVNDALSLLNQTYTFSGITRDEICTVLRMLAGDYEHERDHPARPRILYDRIHDTVSGDTYSRMLILSAGGTIPDRGWYTVRSENGARLGELDEEFVFEARVGDKFLLGAFSWRIAEIRKDSVIVSPATPEGAQSPFWKGDWFGRSYQTGLAFGKRFREMNQTKSIYDYLRGLHLDDPVARNADELLQRQIRVSGVLADDRTILVEHYLDENTCPHLMIHSVFGRKVNACLSLLLQQEASRLLQTDVGGFDDDDGILLYLFHDELHFPEGLLYKLKAKKVRPVLEALLPSTSAFNMAFRYNAARALMMGAGNLGRGRQPLWLQRLKGEKVLDDAVRFSDHPLLAETRRECLEDYWDLTAAEEVLAGIQTGKIRIAEIHIDEPSPLSLPLRRQMEAVMVYDYFPTPSSVSQKVNDALDEAEGQKPEKEILDKISVRPKQPDNAEQLHSLLMIEGDITTEDILSPENTGYGNSSSICAPIDWFVALSESGRAMYIEPGLWICKEQEGKYTAAFSGGDPDIQKQIFRRCLRYRGPQDALSLSDRYFLPAKECERLLLEMVSDRDIIENDGLFYHGELYDRARKQTIHMKRKQVKTLPSSFYADWICQNLQNPATPSEQLRQTVLRFLDVPFPPAFWEDIIFPSRVHAYQPALLDTLLSGGEFFWELRALSGKAELCFHRYEDIDWEADNNSIYQSSNSKESYCAKLPADSMVPGIILTDSEKAVLTLLQSRGASFPPSLSEASGQSTPLDILFSLAEMGFVHADSFVPIRQWIRREKTEKLPQKRQAGARVQTALSGRWEASRPLRYKTPDEELDRAFSRAGLLCKETSFPMNWSKALDILRVWEYTGRVRRGYFIEGLSGAQFIRNEDYQKTVYAMAEPHKNISWLCAADPAQPWGRLFPHEKDKSFLCVTGTGVALYQGKPVVLLEKSGTTLRVLDFDKLTEALLAFARDYKSGHIFPSLNRITVKNYPPEAQEALNAAGFSRQLLNYIIWKK